MTGFKTFGPEHLLWLVILAAAGTAVYRAASIQNGQESIARRERLLLAAAVLPVLGRVLPAIYEIIVLFLSLSGIGPPLFYSFCILLRSAQSGS